MQCSTSRMVNCALMLSSWTSCIYQLGNEFHSSTVWAQRFSVGWCRTCLYRTTVSASSDTRCACIEQTLGEWGGGWRKNWFGVFSLCMWSCEILNCKWKNLVVRVHVCVKQQRWVWYFQDTRIKNSPDRSCSHSVVATSATTFQKKESLKKKKSEGSWKWSSSLPVKKVRRGIPTPVTS